MNPTEDGDDLTRVEYTTTIRGREVSAWLDSGHLDGDPELLRRLERLIDVDDELEPVALAHLIGEAVGSAVVLHLCDHPDGPPTSRCRATGTGTGGLRLTL